MPARRDAITLTAVATLVAGFDQLTKFALISQIIPRHGRSRLELAGGLIGLEYTQNRGAAFGLFAGLAPVLALASIAILGALLLNYSREPQPPLWHTFGIGAIAGGAVGNLFDRVRLGYVIDFVSIGLWPNFNIADSAITFGVGILICGWSRPVARWSGVRTIDQEG